MLCNSNLSCMKFLTFDQFITTMRGYSRVSVVFSIAGILLVEFASSRCFNDTDCRNPGEICCRRDFTCSTNQTCHSLCVIHGHCPAGKQCINSRCKAIFTHHQPSCYSDQDCIEFSPKSKCCERLCKENFGCSISTTKGTVVRSRSSSCISWKDCANGEHCEGGKCEKNSNVMLTKAGFLSAAILTGSVFLLILCCCFVRESRYSRQRFAERQRRSRNRRRSRHRRRRSSHNTTAVANRAFSTEDCPVHLVGGFFIPPPEYPRDLTVPDGNNTPQRGELNSSPPPYHTLSFELPPSYEEVIETGERRDTLAQIA